MLFWGHTGEEPLTDRTTIGHENTGYVVGIGKDVEGFKIGDLVGCLGCSYACWLSSPQPILSRGNRTDARFHVPGPLCRVLSL
ncbi:hypothetical protein LB505_009713 [Fusarium chuoi]|nr:hypothetical protein LB505_009713 [Fusarium chuoi]